jgi:hypothetical protein
MTQPLAITRRSPRLARIQQTYGRQFQLQQRATDKEISKTESVRGLIRFFLLSLSVVATVRLFTLRLKVSVIGGIGNWPTYSVTSQLRINDVRCRRKGRLTRAQGQASF